MNREQRRKEAKTKKTIWPSGYIECPKNTGLTEGEKFTIAGIQRMENGHIIRNCEPGKETVFIAKTPA